MEKGNNAATENRDRYYMQQALIEAQTAYERGEIPVGAVIVHKDRVIARSHNLTETLNDVTAHAEMQAITAAADVVAGHYMTDGTVYVTLEAGVGCAGGRGGARGGRLVFGASDEKRGYLRYAEAALHPKTQVTKGILQEECAHLLTDFFKQRR